MANPAKPRRRFGTLRIFAATSAGRQATVLGCLLAASLAEGFGLASLLPLLTVASGPDAAANSGSAIHDMVNGALAAVGLPADLLVLLIVVVGGIVLKAALTLFAMNHVGYAVAEIATKLRLQLIQALLEARWGYFARQPVGRFANAISSEASRAGDAYLGVATAIAIAFQAIIFLGLALMLSWKLSLASILIGSVIVLSLNRLVRATKRAGRQQTKYTKELVARLSDALVGIKPLKAMARHARLGRLFAADAQSLNDALKRQVFSRQMTRSLQEPLLALFLAPGFYVAVEHWAMPITDLIVMAIVLGRTVTILGKVQQTFQTAVQAESAYWAIYDTIAEARAEREDPGGTRTPTLADSGVFDGVSFAFGAKQVLLDVSLTVPAGKVTTVTGASGAGKTTIADLLLGLYNPDRGQVRIDGVDLQEIDRQAWRSKVGYVPQEVVLFHDTVLANVTLGEEDLTREDAETALEAAGAAEFIAHLPGGIDSIVGERGTLLSGGQRQRIAVARALVRKPLLLILDEATSALDPETEASICRNLKDLSRRTGLTILAISHQPAWVETADRVYRVEGRRVRAPQDEGPARAVASS
jgi:ATP-binding cassette subfamily C protein